MGTAAPSPPRLSTSPRVGQTLMTVAFELGL